MKAKAAIGVCTGLAWTSVGGELLKIEVVVCEGKGKLVLTGQLGDVMKESAQTAFTYIRSRAKELGLEPDFNEKIDIHIHVPEGAIPERWSVCRHYDGNGHGIGSYQTKGQGGPCHDW